MHRIALASLKLAPSLEAGVDKIVGVLETCRRRKVRLVCFSEAYLPGLRGASFDDTLSPPDQPAMASALKNLRTACRRTRVAAIVGMEWRTRLGLENRAVVISSAGRLLGHQTKNQITPGGESRNYVPDGKRKLFRAHGLTFGIVICHEGWRYPETVRWAAVRGARIVFQPQVTGSDKRPAKRGPARSGTTRPRARLKWGEHFYERAMLARAEENSIYFASVNQCMRYQNSATSLIGPAGGLIQRTPLGKQRLLIADIDPALATRRYAKRFRPDLYPL